ncbi:MAG: membrane protein [Methylibium sp. NZG]|nr:MAG: membrane protein [Methylibium sp. NZG]
MPRLLYLLALCNLVLGTGAFLINGILTPVSTDLGVSVAAAGQAMTVYALSTALIAPLMLVATGRWPRRQALVFGLLLFALGSGVCALAGNLTVLLMGRALMGVGAMFTPLAAGIAVALVEPGKRGRALSLVFLGMSMSYVIGLPLGAWLGFRYGWQVPVALVGMLAVVAAAAVWALCPKHVAAPGASFNGLGTVLGNPPVFWGLLMTLSYFVAIFVVFAFIGPVLQALSPMSSNRLSLSLMLFGVAGVIGTVLGGWANDRFGAPRTLKVQLSVLLTMMTLVPLTQGHYPLTMLAFFVWGVAGFGMMTPQQSRLAQLSPAQAPVLLSLNTSMLYFGTALGAAVGGAVSGSVGFAQLAWVGALFALAGLGALWMSTHKTPLLQMP